MNVENARRPAPMVVKTTELPGAEWLPEDGEWVPISEATLDKIRNAPVDHTFVLIPQELIDRFPDAPAPADDADDAGAGMVEYPDLAAYILACLPRQLKWQDKLRHSNARVWTDARVRAERQINGWSISAEHECTRDYPEWQWLAAAGNRRPWAGDTLREALALARGEARGWGRGARRWYFKRRE